jgi:hypothetical protein
MTKAVFSFESLSSNINLTWFCPDNDKETVFIQGRKTAFHSLLIFFLFSYCSSETAPRNPASREQSPNKAPVIKEGVEYDINGENGPLTLVTVDSDKDGLADMLDFNGDGTGDMGLISGTSGSYIGLDVNLDNLTDLYIDISGKIPRLVAAPIVNSVEMRALFNGGELKGFESVAGDQYSVSLVSGLSNSKAITSFLFRAEINANLEKDVAASIEGNLITLVIPSDASIYFLIPTIVHTGASINPADQQPLNFAGSQVFYTVTAEDNSQNTYRIRTSFGYPLTINLTEFDTPADIHVTLNSGEQLILNGSGDFVFETLLPAADAYTLAIDSPPEKTCRFTSNSSGSMETSGITVTMQCFDTVFTVGGTVSGLEGSLLLRLNGDESDDLRILFNGPYTFTLNLNDSYNIGIVTPNPGQNCILSNPAGTVTGVIDNVDISCSAPAANSIAIEVTNADQPNNNKESPAAAQELWAATTLYETSGYESEKVMLTDSGAGVWTGNLPTVDSSPRTILVWDDIQEKPYPLGGELAGSGGSRYAHLLDTVVSDNVFSPCPIAKHPYQNKTIIDDFNTTALTLPRLYNQTGYTGQRFEYVSNVQLESLMNDEVYSLYYYASGGDTVSFDYTEFTKATLDFCGCSSGDQIINYPITSRYYNTFMFFTVSYHFDGAVAGRFTDRRVDAAEENNCPARAVP